MTPFPHPPKSGQQTPQKFGEVRNFIEAVYNIQVLQKYKDDNDWAKIAPKMSKSETKSPKTSKSEPNSAKLDQETPNSKIQNSKSATRPTAAQVPDAVLQMFVRNCYESEKIRIPDTFLSGSSLLTVIGNNDRAEFEAKVINGCEKVSPEKVPAEVVKRVFWKNCSKKFHDYSSLKKSETEIEAEIEACNLK